MARPIPAAVCQECGQRFQPRRTWQKFCTTACRKKSLSDQHSEEYTCEYCGLYGEKLDYVPPRNVRGKLEELGLRERFPFVEVYCCEECETYLEGLFNVWTVKERREIVRRSISVEHKVDSKTPATVQDDASERDVIRAIARMRLDWKGKAHPD